MAFNIVRRLINQISRHFASTTTWQASKRKAFAGTFWYHCKAEFPARGIIRHRDGKSFIEAIDESRTKGFASKEVNENVKAAMLCL
jgi:hypothetical protein